jgi:hypothetical protein
MSKFLFTLMMLEIFQPLFAQESAEEAMVRLSPQIAEQYSYCAAYFHIASEVMRADGKKKYAEGYAKLKDESLFYAAGMAKMKMSPDEAKRFADKRYQESIKTIAAAKDEGKESFGKLLKEKGEYCPKLLKDPGLALDEIVI